MIRHAVAFTLTFLFANSVTAMASEVDAAAKATPIAAAIERAATEAEPAVNPWALPQAQKRPLALAALYGTYGTLQVMDIVSTRRALAVGATERNPLMKGGNMGAMIAVKASTGAATIYFAERLWKKNRVGAVIVMAALNGASAAIVAHNQRNVRR